MATIQRNEVGAGDDAHADEAAARRAPEQSDVLRAAGPDRLDEPPAGRELRRQGRRHERMRRGDHDRRTRRVRCQSLAAVARPDIPRSSNRRRRREYTAIAHTGGASGGDEWMRHHHSVRFVRMPLQSRSCPSSGCGHRGG